MTSWAESSPKPEKDYESTPILEVRQLETKRGCIPVLDIPSLLMPKGRVLSLIGPNGAGKTTLLQTLSYLIKPCQGEIFFKGRKVNTELSVIEYRRKLAMVFQEPLLFNTTVFHNVASGLKIRQVRKAEIQVRVRAYLERFGILHLKDRSACSLSGGEAQRTSLARALVTQPEVLFLDEPFSSLDQPTRNALIEDLGRILGQTQITTILATHDRLEAMRLSDEIAVMNKGRIVQSGSPEEVMNRPINEFVANFVGIETILTGEVVKKSGGTFLTFVSGWEIEAIGDPALGERVMLFIRPEQVTLLLPSSKETTSARNAFMGRIERIVSLGFYQKVELDCGFPLIAYVTNQSLENLSLNQGREVKALVKATAIHVLRKGV